MRPHCLNRILAAAALLLLAVPQMAQVFFPARRIVAPTPQSSNPTNLLPAGIVLWWHQEDLSAGAVSTWTDRVKSYNWVQGTAANRPIRTTNGVVFDGVNDFLTATNMSNFQTGSPGDHAWLIIMSFNTTRANQMVLANTNSGGEMFVAIGGTPAFLYEGSGGDSSVGALNTDWLDLWIGTTDNGVNPYRAYTNGVQGYAIASAWSGASGGFRAVGGTESGASPLSGTIREVIVWSNVVFTASQLAAVHQYATNSLPSISNSRLLRYAFTEGSGTSVADSSGNGYNGTTAGGPTWVTGQSGSGFAMQFDGVDDVLSSASITFGINAVTVCSWIYWDAFSNNDDIMWIGANYGTDNSIIGHPNESSTGRAQFAVRGTTGFRAESVARWTAATWTHIGIVYDNSTATGDVTVYLNGSATGTTVDTTDKTGTSLFATQIMRIMSNAGASSLFGAGRVDDFQIFNGALTATEINAAMNDSQ